MKRKIGLVMIACLAVSLMANGCTKPTQVIAEDSLQQAKDEQHKVVKDLTTRARQSALDHMRAKVNAAVTAQNPAEAEVAMLAFMNEMEKIRFMEITHERSLRLLGVAERYIWEQQGALNVFADEWSKAKKIVKAKKEAEASPD